VFSLNIKADCTGVAVRATIRKIRGRERGNSARSEGESLYGQQYNETDLSKIKEKQPSHIRGGEAMNPLKSITGTLVTGFVLAVIIALLVAAPSQAMRSLVVWLHVFFGITWIGLLYYFNFIQTPATATATADSDGPGPAAISKYVAPLALLWFRWAALLTWLSGAAALEYVGWGFTDAFLLKPGVQVIGIGAWLGTIMLFNVWVLIWPNQKKVLGIVEASAEEVAKAKTVALMASRTNTALSIPMLMCMVGQMHGLPL